MPASQKKEATERKNARINLLFRPSIKRDIEKIAYIRRVSVNDLINTVLTEYIESHEDIINKYNSVFSEQE